MPEAYMNPRLEHPSATPLAHSVVDKSAALANAFLALSPSWIVPRPSR
jgi:hypothetical protein